MNKGAVRRVIEIHFIAVFKLSRTLDIVLHGGDILGIKRRCLLRDDDRHIRQGVHLVFIDLKTETR